MKDKDIRTGDSPDKIEFKPGNMLYPVPVVLVTVQDKEGRDNVFTVAWCGTVCTTPPMLSISVRPERYSYDILKESGEFVVNLVNESLTKAADYCGVRSGGMEDKFLATGLLKQKAKKVAAPLIRQSPVNLECVVRQIITLGSHDLFIAEVVAVHVDPAYLDDRQSFHLEAARPVAYSHGQYYGLGDLMGSFGYSVQKKKLLPRPRGPREKTATGELREMTKNGMPKSEKQPKTGIKARSLPHPMPKEAGAKARFHKKRKNP